MESHYIYEGAVKEFKKTCAECLTLAGGVLAGNAGSALLLFPKEASNGRFDTLLLGRFVKGVPAAVTTAGVAALTILQASQTAGPKGM